MKTVWLKTPIGITAIRAEDREDYVARRAALCDVGGYTVEETRVIDRPLTREERDLARAEANA